MGSSASTEAASGGEEFAEIESHAQRELARKVLSKCPFFKHLSSVARDMLMRAFRMRTFSQVRVLLSNPLVRVHCNTMKQGAG